MQAEKGVPEVELEKVVLLQVQVPAYVQLVLKEELELEVLVSMLEELQGVEFHFVAQVALAALVVMVPLVQVALVA